MIYNIINTDAKYFGDGLQLYICDDSLLSF